MNFAHQIARRTFNEGPTALQTIVRDAMAESSTTREAALVVLAQVFPALSWHLHEACRQTGMSISPMPPSSEELLYLAAARPSEFFEHGARIIEILRELRRQAPQLRADDAPPAEASPKTSPQQISISINMPKTLDANIVSMPTRETTTAVEYSTAGDIVKTTQTERDAT